MPSQTMTCYRDRGIFSPNRFSRILSVQLAGQGANIIHQIPNVIWRLDLTEGRHPGEANSVLNDPKQLLVRIALHLTTGEIRWAWVHPPAQRRLGMAIGTMTYAAFQAVVRTSVVDTCFCVERARRG